MKAFEVYIKDFFHHGCEWRRGARHFGSVMNKSDVYRDFLGFDF